MVSSFSSIGEAGALAAVLSSRFASVGVGSMLRSIFPFGDTGTACNRTKTAGTM